jgi:c-di-GMP-binding flagellar brake protein YcgR
MDDLRRHKRFIVEGIHGSINFTTDVEILNISTGGAAFKTQRRLEMGGRYTMKFKTFEKAISIKGTVVWSVLSESRKGAHSEVIPIYRVGMEFKDVISEKMKEIMDFIEAHKVDSNLRLGGLRFSIRSPEKAALNYPFSYRVKKISLGGMLVEAEHSLNAEDRFPMELHLGGGKTLKFLGRIASCLKCLHEAMMLYDVGIEFVEMSEEDASTLREFIESLEKDGRESLKP